MHFMCWVAPIVLGWTSGTAELKPYVPTRIELKESYLRADSIRQKSAGKVTQLSLTPHWQSDLGFWFEKDLGERKVSYTWFDTATGKSSLLFDHEALALLISEVTEKKVEANQLGLRNLLMNINRKKYQMEIGGKSYVWDVDANELKPGTLDMPKPENRGISRVVWGEVRVVEGRLECQKSGSKEWKRLDSDGGFVRAAFSPDGKAIVGTRVIPGDRKEVHTIRSTGDNQTRGVLQTRLYDQPGDKLDLAEYFVFDTTTLKGKKVDLPEVICGGQPWSNAPGIDWYREANSQEWTFLIDYVERGFQAYRVQRVSIPDGAVTDVINEREATFFDTTKMILRRLQTRPSVIWRSERDGWGHLYLIGMDGKVHSQITKGKFVVRGIERIDENSETLWFRANGRESGDPYFQDLYQVKFDGSGLKRITHGEGNHEPSVWSPGFRWIVDRWSRPDMSPRYEVVASDGNKRWTVAVADDSAMSSVGVTRPETFVAKGRDRQTDIWGLIFRPSNFDEKLTYPVIENIYAGPHDSHVPKAYSPIFSSQQLAELGFIVVQVDGMGTNNRGKAFHDYCWRNLKDAGFPDRIAWMQEAGKKYPQLDLDRVGIYGTSAGGQNSAGAVLFHPEFYKVAVSSCGCHDNRIDKYWWNEQWMGYPVGPWYGESSNIDNAAKLKGHLMLMVGEIDSNVPPESTYRFADALMKAGKEFEMVHLPGLDHTGGGAYGERKRRDYFVRHLLGVEPPAWNSEARQN